MVRVGIPVTVLVVHSGMGAKTILEWASVP